MSNIVDTRIDRCMKGGYDHSCIPNLRRKHSIVHSLADYSMARGAAQNTQVRASGWWVLLPNLCGFEFSGLRKPNVLASAFTAAKEVTFPIAQ